MGTRTVTRWKRILAGIGAVALAASRLPAPASAAEKVGPELQKGLAKADRLVSQEKFDDAIVAFNDLKKLAKGKDDENLLAVRVARVHLARGRVHRAQFALGQVQRENPDYVPGLIEYARLNLYHLGDKPGSVEKAERSLEQAKKVAPQDPEVWTELGYLALAKGSFPDAVERFEKVINTMDKRAYRAYHGLARAHLRSGKNYKAKDAMRACLSAGPDVAENHWMAGNVELATVEPGSEERAIADYLYAVGLEDDVPRYKGWAILVHFMAHRYGQAKPIEDVLAKQAPLNSYLLAARGIRKEIEGAIFEALELYKQAVEADWNNPWPHWLQANVQAGRGNRELVEVASLNPFLYGPFENHAEAARHFRAVERLAPEFPYRDQVAKGLKKAEAHEDGRSNPAFQDKFQKLQGYLGKIRSAPPNPKW